MLRTDVLITGFKTELTARLESLKKVRAELERLYSCRVEDALIDHEDHAKYKEECLKACREAESSFTSFAGSVRSIKSVVETCLIIAVKPTNSYKTNYLLIYRDPITLSDDDWDV